MKNSDIRQEIRAAGLKFWEVAYALGIRDTAFSVMLRLELPLETKNRVRNIIDELLREQSRNG